MTTPSYSGEPICGCAVETMLRERLADADATLTELAPRSDRAAIERVRALAERWVQRTPEVGDGLCGAAILAALDGDA